MAGTGVSSVAGEVTSSAPGCSRKQRVRAESGPCPRKGKQQRQKIWAGDTLLIFCRLLPSFPQPQKSPYSLGNTHTRPSISLQDWLYLSISHWDRASVEADSAALLCLQTAWQGGLAQWHSPGCPPHQGSKQLCSAAQGRHLPPESSFAAQFPAGVSGTPEPESETTKTKHIPSRALIESKKLSWSLGVGVSALL